ncbi:MAG: type IX secretion system membrane protein PorP/SprF [Flavobacteriales bacterium]|nr:type IX secretion system membrane protein PorP/SprF [Flavobacteriales bacterium]
MRGLIVIAFLLLMNGVVGQQSPVLSQYMHHALPLNPAFAGSAESTTFALGYRKQWVGFSDAPRTHLLSAHTPAQNGKLGIGLTAWNDQFGVSKSTQIGGAFAYRMPTRNANLSLGLAIHWVFGTDQWSEVITTEENDPQFVGGNQTFGLPDAGFGLYYERQSAYLSFSVPSLLKRSYRSGEGYVAEFEMESVPTYFNMGGELKLTPMLALRPSAMLIASTQGIQQTDFNVIFRYDNRFDIGASYRTQRAVVGLIRYHINGQLSLAYAYDHWISAIASYQSGTHELTLRYDLVFECAARNPRFF